MKVFITYHGADYSTVVEIMRGDDAMERADAWIQYNIEPRRQHMYEAAEQ